MSNAVQESFGIPTKLPELDNGDTVAKTWPLFTGTEWKCKDRGLDARGNHSFISLPGKEGSMSAHGLETSENRL